MTTSVEQSRPWRPEAGLTPQEALHAADSPHAVWVPEAEAVAHDAVKDCDVMVVAGPGVYDRDAAYVRPLDGRPTGWLAPCSDLQPVIGASS